MFGWLQALSGRRPIRAAVDTYAERKRLEVKDLQLGVTERELKIGAIRRVVESEADPITALEVVTIATHRGKLPPNIYNRRQPAQSPLETLAMGLLEQRLKEDPSDALDKFIERRERMIEAADRLTGRGGDDDDQGGSEWVQVARAVANSPLGEALGAVLGGAASQNMARVATARPPATVVVPAPPIVPPPPAELADPNQVVTVAAAGAPPPPPTARPVSFRVGMMLRTLRAMTPANGARWIAGMAGSQPQVAELVDAVVSAEPEQVGTILEAYLAEASAPGADPQAAEWAPLVAYLLESMPWTLETHAELRAHMFAEDQDDDDDGGDGDGAPELARRRG